VDVGAYLERIGDRGPRDATLSTLRRLHRAHLLAVPFENLDIPLHRAVSVEPADAFAKIVGQRRGGFCYEQNGLFGWVLRALGFQVQLLSARVVNGGAAGPEFDHLALQIDLAEGRFLADVGFGRGAREPLSLDTGASGEAEGALYRVVPGDPDWRVEFVLPERAPQPQYLFTLVPRRQDEFVPMCRYHQSSPQSPFTRKRLCTLATAAGRLTFLDGRLIEDVAGVRQERALAPDEVAPTLRDRFGVDLPDAAVRSWAAG
jgi:N-hydroxyarylamine O-acetyltransferase